MIRRSKWIYVSGPIAMLDDDGKHPSPELMKKRKDMFGVVELFIRDHYSPGAWVVNPVNIPACTSTTRYCEGHGTGEHEWVCYMRHDLRELVMCDEIVMLPGWERSPGATAEFKVAEMLMIPPMFWNYHIPGIQDWPISDRAVRYLEGKRG